MTEMMQRPSLRVANDTSGPETDEALFLSSMIESGLFTPEKFLIDGEDMTCWTQLYEFCADYQRTAGVAPPIGLVHQRFPTFKLTLDIDADWAAKELKRASAGRTIRAALRDATLKLHEGDPDPDAAYDILSQLKPTKPAKPPIEGLTPWLVEGGEQGIRIPVPFKTMQWITKGLGPGTMTLLGARPGEGKTHIASLMIAHAIKEGARVGLLSLEMPGTSIRTRVTRALIGPDNAADLLALETPGDDHVRVMKKIKERTPGSLDIIDPSFGRITPNVVRAFMEGHDLIVIDHVGLLGTNTGGRAIDDWRDLGGISNQLIEDKLATGTAILGLTQLNRKAEEGSKEKPPPKQTVAGADVLVQDADLIITMRRMSLHTMVYGAVKHREGPPGTWYSRFNPGTVQFEELTKDRALEIRDEDGSYE